MYRLRKKNQFLTDLSENESISILGIFGSTDSIFCPFLMNEGSIRVSESIIIRLQRSQLEFSVQKPVSIEWFGTEDRAREFISEVSGGLYERK